LLNLIDNQQNINKSGKSFTLSKNSPGPRPGFAARTRYWEIFHRSAVMAVPAARAAVTKHVGEVTFYTRYRMQAGIPAPSPSLARKKQPHGSRYCKMQENRLK
jgi:hypothetical protein